jgi:hypothetical protein
MGLVITLQDERGTPEEKICDTMNLLHRLLTPYQGKESVLAEIDWYGNTIFNRMQIPRFLSAWQVLSQQAQTPEEATLVGEIRKLAERCESEVHLYLKFIGD